MLLFLLVINDNSLVLVFKHLFNTITELTDMMLVINALFTTQPIQNLEAIFTRFRFLLDSRKTDQNRM